MNDDDKARDETKQMLALIGEAISEWSFVELSLCNLFTICTIPCPARPEIGTAISMIDSPVPTAIFYSTESFRGRLAMVDAALCARIFERDQWAQEIRDEWAKLREKVRKLSLKRNKVAHWTVTPAFYDGEEQHRAKLMPPYGSPGWWKETGMRPEGKHLEPKQVDELVRAFSGVDEKIRDFYGRLGRHPKLTHKFDELTVRLIRSHRRLSPTRSEWIERELSSPQKF